MTMTGAEMELGLKTTLNVDFATARQRAIDALKAEGFGVLTEIDVKETMKQRLGVDLRPYTILGACNPPLAHRALTTAPDIGLLLPCNVTVTQMEDGRVQVAIIDPLLMMSVLPGDALADVAQEARDRLNRVIAALEE
jgi:uncharacterized protein (DUF302 family)